MAEHVSVDTASDGHDYVTADMTANARKATEKEHNMTLLEGVRLYPKAVFWSMLISFCIVMEGEYNTATRESSLSVASVLAKVRLESVLCKARFGRAIDRVSVGAKSAPVRSDTPPHAKHSGHAVARPTPMWWPRTHS